MLNLRLFQVGTTSYFIYYSPDLNIIENVWQMMKVKLYEDAGSITANAELVHKLQLLWRDTMTEKVHPLYSSLPRRIAAVVIKCKGTMTKC